VLGVLLECLMGGHPPLKKMANFEKFWVILDYFDPNVNTYNIQHFCPCIMFSFSISYLSPKPPKTCL